MTIRSHRSQETILRFIQPFRGLRINDFLCRIWMLFFMANLMTNERTSSCYKCTIQYAYLTCSSLFPHAFEVAFHCSLDRTLQQKGKTTFCCIYIWIGDCLHIWCPYSINFICERIMIVASLLSSFYCSPFLPYRRI